MSENVELPLNEGAEPAAPEKDLTFFHERLLPLGWTPEGNIVHVPSTHTGDGKSYDYPLFEADDVGNIIINYYNLNGHKTEYRRDGAKWGKHYQVVRLRVPTVDKHGEPRKYNIPKGAGTYPWFPVQVIEAFRKKEKIQTLFLTEGVFKSYCAANNGVMMVGLSSITHYQDKELQTLHPDVIELIKVCRPTEVVWLVDGDCQELTKKWPEENPDADLFRRPNIFYKSAKNVGELLKDWARSLGFQTYFMHPKPHSFSMPPGESFPKGVDDLLIEFPRARAYQQIQPPGQVVRKPDMTDEQYLAKQQEQEESLVTLRCNWVDEHAESLRHQLVKDMHTFSGPNLYFQRMELDRPAMLRDYFHLRNATDFYTNYQDRILDREFTYEGTRYQWDAEKSELKVKVPSVAKNYVRVGTQYFKRIKVPNKFGELEEHLVQWQKSTIIEDHGKHFCEHVLKLEAFCNVPDHHNWQEIVKGCFNQYARFEHEPDEHAEAPEATLRFLKHIFGSGVVSCAHPKKKDKETNEPIMMEVSELDLGLDYLKLIIEEPTMMLPILCLVSRKRGTGKTTWAKYCKMLLTANAIFVGNKDFESDFNAHYASKKLIILDEALIEKMIVVEKMKSLSTADKIMVNGKGVAQYELGFFGAFLILSNNVRSFIKTDDDETRFWVRSIEPIQDADLDVDLEKKLYNEIPAFLWYLKNRKFATERLYRSWFHPPLLDTAALRELRQHSQPMVRKEIRGYIKRMFSFTGEEVIRMHEVDIKNEVFKGRNVEPAFIKEVLRDGMGLERNKNEEGKEVPCRYRYYRIQEVPKLNGNGVPEGRTQEVQRVEDNVGRPFVFERSMFFDDAAWKLLQGAQAENGGRAQTKTDKSVAASRAEGASKDDDDLPF